MTTIPQRKPPVFTVRPVFDTRFATIQSLLYGAAGTFILTIVGGTFLFILLSLIGIGRFIAPGYLYGLLFVAGVVILPAFFYETKKKVYASTAAHFYDSHVDYQFFQYYLTRKRGRIHYRDIAEVRQKSNFLQEQRHLTVITLYGDDPSYRNSIVPLLSLSDISQTQDYLGFITDLIERKDVDAPVIAQAAL